MQDLQKKFQFFLSLYWAPTNNYEYSMLLSFRYLFFKKQEDQTMQYDNGITYFVPD